MVSSELTPRELHPNCRSDRAAPIACGGLVTARTVAGREYHCPLCGSWRNRELPDISSRYFFAYCLSAGLGVPLHTLMLITATKRMYLVNGYSVVKELRETVKKPPHFSKGKSEGVERNNFLFFQNFFEFG